MDLQQQLALSYYNEISELNREHKISIVQHRDNKRIFVKKVLDIYNRNVYEYLMKNPIQGIPTIYELFEDGTQLIIIEEYISGETLESIITNHGALATEVIIKYTIQLCNILANLHNCSPAIIHRDIKPSNIIITPNDNVVLLDLNAAKYMNAQSQEDTTLLGTKGYAAPEQYGFGSSSTRTDIYAVGVLMNTMAIGSFSLDTSTSILQPIIKKCTELNPENRYSSILELKDSLITINGTPSGNHPCKDWMRFLPPGFRKMNMLHILVASLGYLFIFWLCLTLEVKDANPKQLFIERIMCLIIFLSGIACTCNYLDIQARIPFCNSSNKFLRILGIILLNFIVLSCEFILTVFLSSIAA